ncbi:helix-turn-helix domain-containing protein [Tessaracoccus sp. Y36]
MSTREDTPTPRESAVLAAVERRLSNPEIAAELFISVRTVESHIASLKRKLGAGSRSDLMAAAGRAEAAPMRLSGSHPSPGEVELAAEVCARLDGLPLAIELAAAVARHLSLASRLERDFATLDREVPEGRHRTLETAFEWTWDLLTDEEREVLCRLGALPRTFDVDLAAAVTHPGAEGVVLRLLDHSLIVPAGGHPRRFRLLAVTREFVRSRTEPEVIHEVLRQHAEFLDESVLVFVATARTDSSLEAMHRSETLCPEVNAALRWALAARHPAAVSLANSLSIGVEQFGSDADSIRTLAMAASVVVHDDRLEVVADVEGRGEVQRVERSHRRRSGVGISGHAVSQFDGRTIQSDLPSYVDSVYPQIYKPIQV